MTFTVFPDVDPCLACARRPESSGATRCCPNAIPVANISIMLRRLPHAALCRSPRPVGFRNLSLSLCTIKSHPAFLNGERWNLVAHCSVARRQPFEPLQVIGFIGDPCLRSGFD